MHSERFKNLIIFLFLFISFLSLYFFLRKNNFDADDLKYARLAETGISYNSDFWPSEHPLWGVMGVGVYKASQILGNKGSSIAPIEFLNSCFGALSVSLFFLALFVLTGNRMVSLFVSLILGFSCYFWLWSGSVKYYTTAGFFNIFALFFLFRLEKGSSLNALAVGVSAGISALMHSANLVFFLPLGLAILIRKGTVNKNIINSGIYITGAFLSFVVPHLIINWWILGARVGDFNFWLRTSPWFGIHEMQPGFDIQAHLQKLPVFLEIFQQIIVGYFTSEGKIGSVIAFIAKHYFTFTFFLVLTAFLFAVSAPRLWKDKYPVVIFSVLWFVLMFVSMWLVDPTNAIVYLCLLPVLIIFAISINSFIERFKQVKFLQFSSAALLAVFAVSIFVSNLVLTIVPFHRKNPRIEILDRYKDKIMRGDTVISSGLGIDTEYFLYYYQANVIVILRYFPKDSAADQALVFKSIRAEVDKALSMSGKLYIKSGLLNEEAEIPSWAPPNMNMKEISKFFRENYVIKSIPGDEAGAYLMLLPEESRLE